MKVSPPFAAKPEHRGTCSTTIWSWSNEYYSSHRQRHPAAKEFFLAAYAAGGRRVFRVCVANTLVYSRCRLRPAAWRGAGWGFPDLLPHDDRRRKESCAHVHQDTPSLDCGNRRSQVRSQPSAGGREYGRL